MTDEKAIEDVFRELEQAHTRKDARALQACYSPDALIYNLAPPLSKRGHDPAGAEDWFATWDGAITLEAAETETRVRDDLAVVTGLNRMRGTKVGGERVDLWFRATTVLRRADGRWRIVHDHTSTPFYMDGSYRAATDLVPETCPPSPERKPPMTDQMTAQPKHVLTLDRILDAPVENVWRCWSEPKLLEEWFCPKPWRATEVVMDLRPGGEMTSVFRGPDGESFPNAGVFLVVEPMRRIVSTDAFRAGWVPSERAYMVTETLLAESGQGRTHMIWRALHWSEETMKEHEAMGFHDGWGAAAAQLEALAKSL